MGCSKLIIKITTDVRKSDEILRVREAWIDNAILWKIIEHLYSSNKTHKLEIINEDLSNES